jgi:hypothetical protein
VNLEDRVVEGYIQPTSVTKGAQHEVERDIVIEEIDLDADNGYDYGQGLTNNQEDD